MQVSLTPKAQDFIQHLVDAGIFQDADAAVNAVLERQSDSWQEKDLRRELIAGEKSGYADFSWEEIEAEGDRLLETGAIDRASAALPL